MEQEQSQQASNSGGDWQDAFKGLTFEQFWDKVGWPHKLDGSQHPLYDYEQEVLQALSEHKHIWIKKARGLGLTELILRYMAWLCLRNDDYQGAQMAIITGVRQDPAIDAINRIKRLFLGFELPETRETKVILNGCTITAYPSNANTSRGQDKMAFIFMDEADFFEGRDQQIALEVAEGYIAKTNPWIVLNSTPNLPGGLFERIEKDAQSIYHKVFLPYTKGINKIYTTKDLEDAKKSQHFEREYNLQYGTGIGNIFPYELLTQCIQQYPLALQGPVRVLALDPAYGSSKFGIVGIEQREDGYLYVTQAEQFERASPSAMFERVEYYWRNGYATILSDSARPEITNELAPKGIGIQPVVFQKELSDMTIVASQAVKELRVRIHPAFSDLIQQLRSVKFNEKGHPDKTELAFDLGDAFIMAVKFLQLGETHFFKIHR